MILKGYLISLIYGLFCIGISAIAYKLSVKSFYTRKITHILVGFEWMILQHYFGASIHFVVVCLVFTTLVLIIHKTKSVPSLSSESDNSCGTIYYCLAMTAMSIVALIFPQMMIPFGVGVFCTSFGDGFAGVFGSIKKRNPKIYGNKTIIGFLSCFAFSLISAVVICLLYGLEMNVLYALFIASFAAVLELFAKKGIDNVTITVGVSFLAYFLINYPAFILRYILPIIFTLPIVAFVHYKKALTAFGIIVALILDVIASIAFGNIGFIILISFFGFSLIADKVKKDSEKNREVRTASQVLANGFMGFVFAVSYLIHPSKIWLVAFASVFAEALADTAASGIGSRSAKTYDIFRMKNVEPGVSGGMTVLGTLSALIFSSIIAIISTISFEIGIIEAAVISFSGFVGTIVDSLLGSLLQGKYKCKICGKSTESKIHCNEKTEKTSGASWMDNSVVNLLGTISASAISVACMLCI